MLAKDWNNYNLGKFLKLFLDAVYQLLKQMWSFPRITIKANRIFCESFI